MSKRLAILALALAAFGSSLWSPFFFDDYALATDPAVTRPDGVFQLLSPERTRSLTYVTFWANHQAGGFEAFGYHLVNLLVFALVVWFAGDVFQSLENERAAWIALAIFALHPLQTEAVAYVFARATLLTALFCLLSWRDWLAAKYWRSVGWFAAALLAKEEAAAFPLFLAGFEWFHQRRRDGWISLRGPLFAMFGLVALFAARLLYATRVIAGSGAGLDLGEITPWTYLLTQGRAICLYLRLFVAPYGQNFDRDFRLSRGLDAETALAWAALIALVAGALWVSRRWRPAWWLAGALILLTPTSSFAPLADLTAERRMFLPMLSLALFAATAIAALGGRRAIAVGVTVAAALAAVSWQRTQVFESEFRLWSDVYAKSPDKIRPKLQLARAIANTFGPESRPRIAGLLEEARRLAATPEVLGEIGIFHLQGGAYDKAEAAFLEALEKAADDAQLLSNLGTSLAYQGRLTEAELAFRRALEADECNFDARNNLMLMVSRGGNPAEAKALAQAPAGCPFSQEQLQALDLARDAP